MRSLRAAFAQVVETAESQKDALVVADLHPSGSASKSGLIGRFPARAMQPAARFLKGAQKGAQPALSRLIWAEQTWETLC